MGLSVPEGSSDLRTLLFVVNDLGFFLSHRLPIAIAARSRGFSVAVATPPSPRVAELEALGFQHHPISMSRKGSNPIGELRTLISLSTLLARLKPALVHLVTIKPILYGGIAARLTGIRSISAVCGLGHVFTATGFWASLRRALVCFGYRFALGGRNQRVIFQNPDDRDAFRSLGLVGDDRATLIRGSGVDVTVYDVPPAPQGPPVVLLASRLLRDKGVPEFIEAARLLRTQGVTARFVLAGAPDAGNPASLTEAELTAAASDGAVELWGHHSDMLAVFAQATIVCLPSNYGEGVPKVLIEAASCRRPLVATDVPGCREIVRDGINGLLVPPKNAAALAEAIRQLIADPVRREVLGNAGRRMVEDEFSLPLVVENTMRVYAQLVPLSGEVRS